MGRFRSWAHRESIRIGATAFRITGRELAIFERNVKTIEISGTAPSPLNLDWLFEDKA
jgi:hypothetical protein